MNPNPYSDDIAHIRSIMEKSSRFLSLSGWAGILPGIYALIGLTLGLFMMRDARSSPAFSSDYSLSNPLFVKIILLALAVLILSLLTSWIACMRKARQNQQSTWTPAIRNMLFYFSIPLVTGGIILIWVMSREYTGLIAPVMLSFYGLALIQASHFTIRSIFWLGLIEIALAVPAGISGFGIPALALGFGVAHIVYGALQLKNVPS